MKGSDFNHILKEQLQTCSKVLSSKAAEYAGDKDRLHNFKQAAALTPGETQAQALGGMMKKHTISIYDMINNGGSYPQAIWDEKITDHINYLILLKAVVSEQPNA